MFGFLKIRKIKKKNYFSIYQNKEKKKVMPNGT